MPLQEVPEVVTFILLLSAETLFAASFAFTLKLYPVSGVRPVTLKLVLAVVPILILSLKTS